MTRRRRSVPTTEAWWRNPYGPLFESTHDALGRPFVALHVCKIEDLGATQRTVAGWEEDGEVVCLRWGGEMAETSWWRRVAAPTKSYAIRIEGQIYEFDRRRMFACDARWAGWDKPKRGSKSVRKMIDELGRRATVGAA